MQWTGPGSGAKDQIIAQKWLTRGGSGATLAALSLDAYRLLGYSGGNMRGLVVSHAVRDADIQTEFGADVVLTDATNGVPEDIAYPAGVIDDNVYWPDAVWQKKLIQVVMFGRVNFIYGKAPTFTQTLFTLATVSDAGVASNYGYDEFTGGRRLGGSTTTAPSGAAGPFSMAGDATGVNWTNGENAPYMDVLAILGTTVGGVPNAAQGIVGIGKAGVADSATGLPGAPSFLANTCRRQCIVTCMGISVGRV